MTKYEILLLLLLISTLISVVVIVVNCIRKRAAQGLVIGGLMLITPVFGPSMVFLSFCGSKLLEVFKTARLDPKELSFDKTKIKVILGDDIQRGINKVPIEEALLESDNENTRKVLLDILKSDYDTSIPLLKKAIDSEDSEVSHYASAAISDVLSKFKKTQELLDKQYCENPEERGILISYKKYMLQYLDYGIFPETELNTYLDIYESLMKKEYELFKEEMEVGSYLEWIRLLLKENRQKPAENWKDKMMFQYPDALETYKVRLQYSYQYDKKDFLKCICEIKESSVELDDEVLDIVRFFQTT